MWKCLNRNESRSRTRYLRTLARMSALALLASASAGGCGAPPSEVDEAADPTTSGAGSTTTTTLALDVEAGSWKRLGANLNPTPTEATSRPSLAFDQHARPVVGFSRGDATNPKTVDIVKWRGTRWHAAGPTLAGEDPKIAIDSQDRVVVCMESFEVTPGPFVRRLSGSTWTALGGSVAVEAGYYHIPYRSPTCRGVVIDEWDGPNIIWTASHGSHIWRTHAARWSRSQQLWRGLNPTFEELKPGETVGVNDSAAIDDQNRVYLATYHGEDGHAGEQTTRVWRHDDDGWEELGPKILDAAAPVVAVSGDSTPYLAMLNRDGGEDRQDPPIPSDTIYVKRWSGDAWQDLPSPGVGTNLSLGFTPSGRPVLAYFDAKAPNLIRVKHLVDGAWVELGTGLEVLKNPEESLQPQLDLKVDPRGRATLAWTQGAPGGFTLFVDRYHVALP
jgi:hypothetical protein